MKIIDRKLQKSSWNRTLQKVYQRFWSNYMMLRQRPEFIKKHKQFYCNLAKSVCSKVLWQAVNSSIAATVKTLAVKDFLSFVSYFLDSKLQNRR